MGESIHVYDAIRQMRQISKKQGSFSMVFMSLSRSRGTSDGIVEISNARLRPQDAPGSKYGDYMLNYVDINTGEANHMWQPLLMYFNGQKINL